MTTSVAPPEVRPELDPLRVLRITANLLPVEITDARREHKLRWIVAAFLVVVLGGLGFWDFQAKQQTSAAQKKLDSSQSQIASLHQQLLKFTDLNTTKSSAATIEAELTKLMSQDIKWYQVLPALRSAALAAGVNVANISATLNKDDGQSTAPTAAAGATPVGSITITGTAPDQPSAAAFLEQLAKVPGFTGAYMNSLNAQGTQFQFTGLVSFTSALYQGRFTPAAANGGK